MDIQSRSNLCNYLVCWLGNPALLHFGCFLKDNCCPEDSVPSYHLLHIAVKRFSVDFVAAGMLTTVYHC